MKGPFSLILIGSDKSATPQWKAICPKISEQHTLILMAKQRWGGKWIEEDMGKMRRVWKG